MYAHVPDAGKLLIHRLHIVRANRYKGLHSNAGMTRYWGGVVTSSVGIYASSYFRHHMISKKGTTVGYGSVPGVVFTGGVGIVIIHLCGTNITCCVCVLGLDGGRDEVFGK